MITTIDDNAIILNSHHLTGVVPMLTAASRRKRLASEMSIKLFQSCASQFSGRMDIVVVLLTRTARRNVLRLGVFNGVFLSGWLLWLILVAAARTAASPATRTSVLVPRQQIPRYNSTTASHGDDSHSSLMRYARTTATSTGDHPIHPFVADSIESSTTGGVPSTLAPTLTKVVSKEVSNAPWATNVPASSSPQPVNKPTTKPTISVPSEERPVGGQELVVDSAVCEDAWLDVDADFSQSLTLSEYTTFLLTVAQGELACNPALTALDDNDLSSTAFESSLCLCTSVTSGIDTTCCSPDETTVVDISIVYLPANQRTFQQRSVLTSLCTLAGQALPSTCPTLTPTLRPVALPPNSPPRPPPSRAPMTARPVVIPTRAPQFTPQFETCLTTLLLADANADDYLTPTEYLVVVRDLTGCFRYTSLEQAGMLNSYNSLLCDCAAISVENPCCDDNGNARIPIVGVNSAAGSTLTSAQIGAITTVCSTTRANINIIPAENACPTTVQDTETTEDAFLQACVTYLADADANADSLLNAVEYLDLIVNRSNCNLITALSEDQAAAYDDLNTGTNNNINILGSALDPDDRTAAQRANLRNICTVTDSVIADSCVATTRRPVTAAPRAVAAVPTRRPTVSPLFGGTPRSPPIASTRSPTTEALVTSTVAPSLRIAATLSPTARTTMASSSGDLPITLVPSTGIPRTRIPTVWPTTAENFPSNLPSLQERITTSPTISVETSFPTIPRPVSLAEQSCQAALAESDIDTNGSLDKDEFLTFVQLYSKCSLTRTLLPDQTYIFQEFACLCLNSLDADPQCCFPGVANVHVNGSTFDVGQGNSYTESLCAATSDTFVDECISFPTVTPLVDEYLDQCSVALIEADMNNDMFLDKPEYLKFIQIYGQGMLTNELDWGHISTFHSLACDCVGFPGATYECCLPGIARLNITGVDNEASRKRTMTATLSKICTTADGLTKRTKKTAEAVPFVNDCIPALIQADKNEDARIDEQEYTAFMQREYSEQCSSIRALSLIQRTVFRLLACQCLFEVNAPIDCCLSDNVTIDISSAVEATESSRFLSSICKASNATVEVGCRSPPVETKRPSATVATTRMPATNLAPKASIARSFFPSSRPSKQLTNETSIGFESNLYTSSSVKVIGLSVISVLYLLLAVSMT